jgi:Ca2+-binding EF-hand superfamily protein
MDPRVSTAPAPKGKRWVAKNNGASCLLRQPSGSSVNAPVSAVADRPHTCPTPTLTPRFHWNLNNSALKTLTPSQIQDLYGLFKFYDSSTRGDSLPSIKCSRLVEILRDARLLSDSAADSVSAGLEATSKRLSVESVAMVFAQAAMGKMRVYLDADGEPALPFPLFCGALMNCAMLLVPSVHPEPALRQLLALLLEGPIVHGKCPSTSKGLLRHLPTAGATSLWSPQQSFGPHQQTEAFLARSPFQRVIADCTRDKALAQLQQERLARSYEIPPRLLASFHRDTVALISSKFRVFDVFDRGALPRHEIFPLLSSLGEHADLPAPSAVVSRLSAQGSGSLSGSESAAGGELTLAQLLEAIEAARDAKRHSITARLAAMKGSTTREEPTPLTPTQKPDALPTFEEVRPDDGNSIEHAVGPDEATHSHHGSVSKERAKRSGVSRSRSRRSIVSQGVSSTGANNSSHSLLDHKQHTSSKAPLAHHASVSGKKKAELRRKSSSKASVKHEATRTATESNHSEHNSGSSDSADSDEEENVDQRSSPGDDSSSDANARRPSTSRRVLSVDGGRQVLRESSTRSKTLQVFLLLGGDHDGAICCSISLSFRTREIVESEGLFLSTAPSEITRTSPILPTQATLTNALLMLKKRVLAKVERGFELRPTNQLDAVERLLEKLQKSQPRFSIARGPVAKVSTVEADPCTVDRLDASRSTPGRSQHSATIALDGSTSSPNLLPTTAGRARAAAGPPVRALPRSKPAHLHQLKLPHNYRELLSTWGVNDGESCAWILDLNAASPLRSASPTRSQSKAARPAMLCPLRMPPRQEN